MNTYHSLCKLPLLIALLCSCFFCSCTDDSPTLTSKKTQKKNTSLDLSKKNPLLMRLPQGTYAVLSFLADVDSYQRYSSSRWGQGDKSVVDVLRDLQSSQRDMSDQIQVFVDLLEASGVLGSDNKNAIAKALAFANLKEEGKSGFDVGLLIELTDGQDAATMITQMKEALAQHEFTISSLDNIGDVALTIEKEMRRAGSQKSIPFRMSLAGTGSYFATSSNPKHLESLLKKDTKTAAFQQIADSALYKKSVRSLGDRTKEYGFAYIDIASVVPSVQAPPINLQSLAWSRQMLAEGPGEFMSAVVEPRNEKERSYMNLLEKDGRVRSLEQFPSDTIAYVGIDLDVWSKAFTEAMNDKERASKKDFLDLLDSLSDIAIGIKGSRNSSPFPEILIGMNADTDPAPVLKTIESQLGGLLVLTGINMSSWQESMLDGVQVRYSMTPFGMGVYMGSYKKAAFITTSKSSAQEYIATLKGTAPGLTSSLPKNQQALVTKTHPIAITTINFHKLGTLIEVFQGNLALFTGGKSMDQSSIENLKRAGMLVLSLTLSDNVFQLTTHFSEPTADASK